jgi:hypothetical protein
MQNAQASADQKNTEVCSKNATEVTSLFTTACLQQDLVSTTYAAWPMIPNSVLEKNCTIYKMVCYSLSVVKYSVQFAFAKILL